MQEENGAKRAGWPEKDTPSRLAGHRCGKALQGCHSFPRVASTHHQALFSLQITPARRLALVVLSDPIMIGFLSLVSDTLLVLPWIPCIASLTMSTMLHIWRRQAFRCYRTIHDFLPSVEVAAPILCAYIIVSSCLCSASCTYAVPQSGDASKRVLCPAKPFLVNKRKKYSKSNSKVEYYCPPIHAVWRHCTA
jgi:hypothetical protein